VLGCAGIAQAAVIGVHQPKWQERPLLICVAKPGASVSREQVLDYLRGRVSKWWLPDDVVFLPQLPLTATGKISKLALREQFKNFSFAEHEPS
jgi:fatty-acyl-CoA synthase